MIYQFKCKNKECEKNNDIQLVTMSIKEYTSKGHLCECCGAEMVRDINDFATTFDTSKINGFYGKSSN